MAKHSVIGFEISTLREPAGRRGRKIKEDQMLRMEVAGGSVYLRKSTLEAAGDNWLRFKHRLSRLAEEKGIPYTDDTETDTE